MERPRLYAKRRRWIDEVILFYVCCDESVSMAQKGGIEAINFSLPELHAQLVEDPLVVDKSRLAIIAFSDTAQVVLPLSKATDIEEMPGVAEVGGCRYGALRISAWDYVLRSVQLGRPA
jgi:uncharacterized protein YegL